MNPDPSQKPLINDEGELLQDDPQANPRDYAYFVEALQIETTPRRRFSLLNCWWMVIVLVGMLVFGLLIFNAASQLGGSSEGPTRTPVTPHAIRATVTPRVSATPDWTATFSPVIRPYLTDYPLTLTQQAVYASPTPF